MLMKRATLRVLGELVVKILKAVSVLVLSLFDTVSYKLITAGLYRHS